MIYLIIFLAFIFGTIIGSFLNVVVFRTGTGMGIGGRSMCLSCNRNLHWYELIPIISFLLQFGKCRTCRTKISWQYPVVEFFTGILFAANTFFLWQNVQLLVVSFILISLGMVIAAYDAKHKIIHLPSLVAFFVVGTVFVALQKIGVGESLNWITLVFGLRGAFFVTIPFFLLWVISGGRWIGFGDIEIMVIAGWLLGISGGYAAVFFAFWIACVLVLPMYVYFRVKNIRMDHQIPMGPFLLLGIYLVMICGWNIFNNLPMVIL